MKAMEIDSSGWTDEMRKNAVRKLEELGYKEWSPTNTELMGNPTLKRILTFAYYGEYHLDYVGRAELLAPRFTPTYEQLMAMTKEGCRLSYREKYKRAFNVHDDKIHCESCQRYGEFDVHHIQARGMGGDPNGKRDIIENLMGLCRKCHEWHGDKKHMRFYLYESHRQALVSKEVEFDEELMEQLKHGKRL